MNKAFGRSRIKTTIVCVQGESGTGKSSLVTFFLQQQQESARPPTVLSVKSYSSDRGNATPYMRLLEALRAWFSQLEEPFASSTRKLMRNLAPIWSADAIHGGSGPSDRPQPEHHRLHQLETFLRELRKHNQLIIFFDDVQWLDDASARLFVHLFRSMQSDEMFFIATWQQDKDLTSAIDDLFDEAAKGDQLIRIPVDKLTDPELESFIHNRHPNVTFPEEFYTMIREISGMNALYVDVLLKAKETKSFGEAVRLGTASGGTIPELRAILSKTQNELVSKRLKRLPQDSLRILEQATFQGTEFDVVVLSTALQLPTTAVEQELIRLSKERLLIERIGQVRMDDGILTDRYRFKHSYFVEALKGELTDRAASNAIFALQMAHAQELHYAKSLSQSASRLAVLYETANDLPEEIKYRVLAAETSLQLADSGSALRFAEQALGLLSRAERSDKILRLELRAQLVAGLSTALRSTYAAEEVRQHYAEARRLADKLDDKTSRFPALAGAWLHELVIANLELAGELAAEMRALSIPSETEQQQIDSVEAWWAVGVTAYFRGNLTDACDALRNGVAAYQVKHHKAYAASYPIDPGVSCHYLLGRALCLMGKLDSALLETTRAIALARELKHSESEAFAVASEAVVRHLRREPEEVLQLTDRLSDLARGDGLHQFKEWWPILQGWAHSALGDTTRGFEEVEAGLTAYVATGSVLVLPSFQCISAECLLRAGRHDEAHRLVQGALTQSKRHSQHYADAELLRYCGEAMYLRGMAESDRDQAIGYFRAAFQTAEQQGAQLFALRAAISLAQAASTEEEHTKANAQVRRMLNVVTEGHSTLDFLQALQILQN